VLASWSIRESWPLGPRGVSVSRRRWGRWADGRLTTVLAFAIQGGTIVLIDVFRNPARFHQLKLAVIEDTRRQ
jgi:hypothetical protein